MKAQKSPLNNRFRRDGASDFSRTKSIVKKIVPDDIPTRLCAHLEIKLPGRDAEVVRLKGADVVLGRSSSCGVQLPLPDVSRLHARLTCRKDEFLIEDLESTNGTFVNGVRIQKCILRNNDQIQAGDAKIVFIEERIRRGK